MKAMTYSRYGSPDVVTLSEASKPTPKPNEVLIRILATTVTSGDYRARSLDMPAGFGLIGRLVFGLTGPRQPILGTELAGIVESVGAEVMNFNPGDEVMAFTGGAYGSHAEYRTMPATGTIVHKPANLSFEEAASLSFGSMTALPFLRDKARIKAGDTVLVVGASGAVGTAAVQIARHFGADVTGVTSTANVELVAGLGARRVIDYTRTDFATTGETWDIILDTTATVPFARCAHALKPGGRLVAIQGSFAQALGIGKPSKASGKKVIAGYVPATAEDLRYIARLASDGELKPVVDRTYRLEEAVAAHAYVDTGRKRGSVVLTVGAGEADFLSGRQARVGRTRPLSAAA
ncbi:NAD(P)-dependent alcohol dehydrogenase [Devosia sp.]|uniref:NAD(P)-dependent alcohol dehydrogenase n=1 Tax=Devosia sp. TaxID=1871048 RepID=UPI001AC2CE56|nr:NAD(P)-dependent alcohol dehydrogenase [Devosia sp.]MBN9309945.1 NAD(P)-dependent alcohol dehydrogenase [Devosia sp.]